MQKDFLFGALLREVGVVARHDVLFGTLGLCLVVVASRSKTAWLGRLIRLPIRLYNRLFSRPATQVADAYAALHGALHHLLQYLCFTGGVGEEPLTARADAPRLAETARQMLRSLETLQAARTGATREPRAGAVTPVDRPAGPVALDRSTWLAHIFHGPIAPPRMLWIRAAGAVATIALVGALLARSISGAIAYHPTYVQRMHAQGAASTLREESERETSR